MENNKENVNEINKKNNNNDNNNIENNMSRINVMEEKFKYFEETKDNYDKLFIHANVENMQLIENNLDIIDKKIDYLKLNKEFYNNKKHELNLKLQRKKQTKNLFIEELVINNNNENKDSYFNIEPEAYNYSSNNKNILYKSEGLVNIFNDKI